MRKLPPKYKDSDILVISYTIDNVGLKKAMCDLGASINMMSLSIYLSLNVGLHKKTSVVIQLANKSIIYLMGVLKDIVVQVDSLVFSTNFYIIDIE